MRALEDEMTWPLLLRTGFGNVFPHGRWDHDSTEIIAHAINTGDWSDVELWANELDWDEDSVS